MAQHINRYQYHTYSLRPQQRRKPRPITVVLVPLVVILAVCLGLWKATHHFYLTPGASASKSAVASSQPATQDLQAAPAPIPIDHTDSQLNTIISSWAGQNKFTASVVVAELTGGQRTASYSADASFVPASTYKIYVAYSVLHAIEQGTYSLNTKLSDGHSVQTDLSNMITNSDNSAARTLGFLIGWKNIDSLLQAQGLTATSLNNYTPPSTQPVGDKHTTANDMAAILGKLYAGELLNKDNTSRLLQLMQTQHYRQRIPAGIPSSVTVADKPGWLTPADGYKGYIQNDAGIVYGPKSTYAVVIMTTGSTTKPLASLSTLIYNYLQK